MSLPLKIYRRLRGSFRFAINAMMAEISIYTGYYRRARGCRIIVYHGICEKDPLRFNTLFVTRNTFEKHLRFYQKYCHLLSLEDYYQGRFDKNRFNICISFDDGFEGVYRYGLPLLEKYQVPAAFFITGIRDAGGDILWNDFLSLVYTDGPDTIRFQNQIFRKQQNKYREPGKNISLNDWLRTRRFEEKKAWMEAMQPYASFKKDPALRDYWVQMDCMQIRELSASPLTTIGAHGYYHNDLAEDEEAVLKTELEKSKQFLEKLTGKEVKSIAFPYGSYSPRVIDAAKQAGYQQLLAAYSLSDSDREDPSLRERLGINPFIGTAAQLRAIIKGNYA